MSVKIGLDAGHGLKTPGKQTPDGIKEWTLNDKVCDKITEMLKDYDCTIIRTDHNEGNIDEPLSQRVNEYLKAGLKCLISIHHNANTGKWNSATGVEVYTDRNFTTADERLAKIVHSKLSKYTGLKDRGIKRANFWIINQNKVPAILIEGGFMDGTNDYKVITSDKGQTDYARAVAESLIEFCELKKKTTKPTTKPTTNKAEKGSITYQVHEYKKAWTENVKGKKYFAGDIGKVLDAVKADLTNGNIWYKVHIKGGKLRKGRWLPEVKNCEDYAGNIGQPIDAVMFKVSKGKVKYQVMVDDRWLPEVSGYDEKDSKNGYAGNIGKTISAIRVWIE